MSCTLSRTATVAVAALLLISVVYLVPLYGQGNTTGAVKEGFVLAQSGPATGPQNGENNGSKSFQSKPKGNQGHPKDEKSKPPIGVCRESWIGGQDKPTYHCEVLFGPV